MLFKGQKDDFHTVDCSSGVFRPSLNVKEQFYARTTFLLVKSGKCELTRG